MLFGYLHHPSSDRPMALLSSATIMFSGGSYTQPWNGTRFAGFRPLDYYKKIKAFSSVFSGDSPCFAGKAVHKPRFETNHVLYVVLVLEAQHEPTFQKKARQLDSGTQLCHVVLVFFAGVREGGHDTDIAHVRRLHTEQQYYGSQHLHHSLSPSLPNRRDQKKQVHFSS